MSESIPGAARVHKRLDLGLLNKFHGRAFGDHADGGAFVEEAVDGFAAAGAVVEGPFVDVHADEFVGEFEVHVAAEAECVFDGFVAVVEGELDRFFENAGDVERRVPGRGCGG